MSLILINSHEPIQAVADAEYAEAECHAVFDVSMIDSRT
jgi:hypothetical protein